MFPFQLLRIFHFSSLQCSPAAGQTPEDKMQIFTFTKVKRISCNVKVNISNPEILSFSFLELILDLCILSMSYEFSYNPSTDKEPYFISYFFYFYTFMHAGLETKNVKCSSFPFSVSPPEVLTATTTM